MDMITPKLNEQPKSIQTCKQSNIENVINIYTKRNVRMLKTHNLKRTNTKHYKSCQA